MSRSPRKGAGSGIGAGPETDLRPGAELGPNLQRRRLLRALAIAGTAAMLPRCLHVPGAFAEEMTLTPWQTEGPFYPSRLPLDRDNDLILIGDGTTPARGAITHLTGKILDRTGRPIRNALVEIWQVDHNGVYLHEGSADHERRDRHFQGYGRFETGSGGEYRFRTIKPVSYPGRTPHIHVGVTLKGHDRWTTQCYIKGEPRNARDGILGSIRDRKQRDSVIVEFAPVKGSRIGELAARFDVVMGLTPKM